MDPFIVSAYEGVRKTIHNYHGYAFNVKRSEDKTVDTIVFELNYSPDHVTVVIEMEEETLRPTIDVRGYSAIDTYDTKKKVYLDTESWHDAFVPVLKNYIAEYRCTPSVRRNKMWLVENKLSKRGKKGAQFLGYKNFSDMLLTFSALKDKGIIENVVCSKTDKAVSLAIVSKQPSHEALYFETDKEMGNVLAVGTIDKVLDFVRLDVPPANLIQIFLKDSV